nr:NYN domain-containing protein [Candidatus Njordarchaeum guaymaensis]
MASLQENRSAQSNKIIPAKRKKIRHLRTEQRRGRPKISKISRLAKLLRFRRKGKRIGLIVDGSSLDSKEYHPMIGKVKDLLEDLGVTKVAKVVVSQQSSHEETIKLITQQGYSPMVVPGDVDVHVALEAADMAFNPKLSSIVLLTTNLNILPALTKAKELGKETILLRMPDKTNEALENAADIVILLDFTRKQEGRK